MFSYSPLEVYRCCQHNVSHGWPYYAEELWLATPDLGLCASLFAASEVTAKVAGGVEVRLTEDTDYPSSERVTVRVSCGKAAQFPLYFRIPSWCSTPTVVVNGEEVKFKSKPRAYLVLSRVWKDQDTIVLRLPIQVSVRRWVK